MGCLFGSANRYIFFIWLLLSIGLLVSGCEETRIAWRCTSAPVAVEVEEIERGILLRELEAQMTPEEAWVFHQKALGFSSEEIARSRGSSVNSVDKVMSRLKQKIHALIGVKE